MKKQEPRQKITVLKKPGISIPAALGINEMNMFYYEKLLREKFSEYSQVSDVIEYIWNDASLSNEEVIIFLTAIGRAQGQSEYLEGQKKMLADIFSKISERGLDK